MHIELILVRAQSQNRHQVRGHGDNAQIAFLYWIVQVQSFGGDQLLFDLNHKDTAGS